MILPLGGWELVLGGGGQKFYILQWFVGLQSSSLSNDIFSLVFNFYTREKLVILGDNKKGKVGEHCYKLSGRSKWWETVDDVDKTNICEKNTVQRETFSNLA